MNYILNERGGTITYINNTFKKQKGTKVDVMNDEPEFINKLYRRLLKQKEYFIGSFDSLKKMKGIYELLKSQVPGEIKK